MGGGTLQVMRANRSAKKKTALGARQVLCKPDKQRSVFSLPGKLSHLADLTDDSRVTTPLRVRQRPQSRGLTTQKEPLKSATKADYLCQGSC